MALPAGRHQIGPQNGHLVLRTFRAGLASQAGHDLIIDVARWEGDVVVGDDLAPAYLQARIYLGSLAVREGTGGIKPLTDADRSEIATTARRLLRADQHPEAEFTASSFVAGERGGEIDGALTLRGVSRPLRLQVEETGPGRYRARGTVIQSAYGIKPYTAFFGALKVRDGVDVEVEAQLPDGAPPS